MTLTVADSESVMTFQTETVQKGYSYAYHLSLETNDAASPFAFVEYHVGELIRCFKEFFALYTSVKDQRPMIFTVTLRYVMIFKCAVITINAITALLKIMT